MRQLLVVSIFVLLVGALSFPMAGLLAHISLNGRVGSVATSPDGSRVAVGTQIGRASGEILLLDRFGTVIWHRNTDRDIGSLIITPDGKYLVAAGIQYIGPPEIWANGEIYFFSMNGALLWNLTTGSAPVFALTLAPDDSHIIARTGDGVIAVSSAEPVPRASFLYLDFQGKILWRYETPSSESSSYAVGGSYIVATAETMVYPNSGWVYALDVNGKPLWNQTGLTDFEFADTVTISHDGKYVAVSGGQSGTDGSLYLLDASGNVLWKHHINSEIFPIVISPDDQMVITGSNWWTMAFDIKGQLLWNLTIPADSIAVTPDSSQIFVGIYRPFGSTIFLLNREGNTLWSFPIGYCAVSMSSDGSLLIAAAASSGFPPFSLQGDSVYLFERSGVLRGLNVNLGFAPLFPTTIGLLGDGIIVLSLLGRHRLKAVRSILKAQQSFTGESYRSSGGLTFPHMPKMAAFPSEAKRRMAWFRRRWKVLAIILLGVIGFSLFVPVLPVPDAHYTLCIAGSCQEVTQYGSLTYIYLCSGTIYATSGQYWWQDCLYF